MTCVRDEPVMARVTERFMDTGLRDRRRRGTIGMAGSGALATIRLSSPE
jgi:hypothetical protein